MKNSLDFKFTLIISLFLQFLLTFLFFIFWYKEYHIISILILTFIISLSLFSVRRILSRISFLELKIKTLQSELSEIKRIAEKDQFEYQEFSNVSPIVPLLMARLKSVAAVDSQNQLKSEFLAHMSHELRTPLNAILGFSQIIMRDPNLSIDQRENVSIINRSGDYLLNLINNILELSKLGAKKAILNPCSFNLSLFLSEIEDLLNLQAESKGLQLLFDLDPSLPTYINTDEIKLRQVLINLINNGIKFTSEGGVSVKSFVKKSQGKHLVLVFEVQDTGVGIMQEEINKVFEIFEQTESGKKSQQGAGLGLPISQRFVQLMGGDIQVNSVIGKGTTFTFDIQAEIVDASEVQPKPIPRHVIALKPGQPCYRILVVDDRPYNRLLLFKLLQPLGFELQEASNGKEAVEKWDTWDPHLVFMDMRMPIMNGYEATQKIKGTVKGSATIVIALTASVLEEERAIVLSSGCDDFLRKPFRESTIFEALNKYLGVEYIYEELEKREKDQSLLLTASDFQVMPEEWVARLYNASKALDDDLVLELIEEIPETYSSLSKHLTSLVNSFQLKQIRDLIELQD